MTTMENRLLHELTHLVRACQRNGVFERQLVLNEDRYEKAIKEAEQEAISKA